MESKNYISVPKPNSEELNPVNEKVIAQMRKWLSDVYPLSQVDRALKIEKTEGGIALSAKIWTATNEYSISAHVSSESNYLGCISTCRKPRPGETWTRGNDLYDGRFCEETWKKILQDIVRYETEEVKSEKWKK